MARITVEDCLKRVPSRFALAIIAFKRAKMLLQGSPPLVKCDNKAIVTALREIAAGKVIPIRREEKTPLEEAKVKILEAMQEVEREEIYEAPELIYEPEEGRILEEEEEEDESRD